MHVLLQGSKQCNPGNAHIFYSGNHNHIAVQLCYDCPVMIQCGEKARELGEVYGTWGGETAEERCAWLKDNHPDPDIRALADIELHSILSDREQAERKRKQRQAKKNGTVYLPPAKKTRQRNNMRSSAYTKLAQARALKAREMAKAGTPLVDIANELNISLRSVGRYLGPNYDHISA